MARASARSVVGKTAFVLMLLQPLVKGLALRDDGADVDTGAEAATDEQSPQVQAFTRLQHRLADALDRANHPVTTKPSFDIASTSDTASGCQCSENGRSGDVAVPYIACGTHLKGFSAFCFVVKPDECSDFSKESNEFPGGRWRLCTPPQKVDPLTLIQAGQNEPVTTDANTNVVKEVENGISKYTMQHSGMSTTMVTEGDTQLEGEAGKNRTRDLIKDVKQVHKEIHGNVSAELNQTKAAVDLAYHSVNQAMFGAMDAINTALADAFKDEEEQHTKPTTDQDTFSKMFSNIQGRVLDSTSRLRPSDDTSPNGRARVLHKSILEPGPKETLYDRMLKMGDNMRDKMDRKFDSMNRRMAQKASSASAGSGGNGPVTVSTKTY